LCGSTSPPFRQKVLFILGSAAGGNGGLSEGSVPSEGREYGVGASVVYSLMLAFFLDV